MKVAIAGGTGFLGQALARRLRQDGDEVLVLTGGQTRPAAGRGIPWNPDGHAGAWSRALAGVQAIINLAGESIAARRWTPAQKARIHDSRTSSTRSLVAAI